MKKPAFYTRRLLKAAVQRSFLPLALLASLAAYCMAIRMNFNADVTVTASSITILIIAMALERWIPHRTDWNTPQGDSATDWTSFACIAAVAEPLAKALMAAAVVAVYGQFATPSWALADAPLALQIIAATLAIELGKYAAHRLHHALPALWWLHALHHSAQRLYAVNNFRYHPLNYAINQALSMLPLMLLGAPPLVLFGYLAITQPIVMVQHANIALRGGWLNALLSTPEAHRWHHSAQRAEGDSNFGNAILLWDHVFGTYKAAPTSASAPSKIGLYAPSSYPATQSYWQQLQSMFSPICCKAA
jgi:ornithine lipid hydroxylase